MIHRISARGLLVNADNALLLAREHTPGTGAFWIPPGGGVEPEDGSAVDCVRREFYEETGLTIEVGPLLYVREFSAPSQNTHHFGLYFLVQHLLGTLHETDPDAPPHGADLRRHVQWFTLEQLKDVRVFPQELRNAFWQDRAAGVTQTTYLDVAHED